MFVLLSFICGFFLGVSEASLVDFTVPISVSFMLLIGLVFRIRFWGKPSALFLCAILFVLGAYGGHLHTEYYERQGEILAPIEEWVELEGEVVSEIDRRVDKQNVTILTEYGRVLVKLSVYEKVEYGDFVRVGGMLERPSDDIEGFNYAQYLARYKIWIVMNEAYFEVLEEAGPSLLGSLYAFKGKLEQRLNVLFFEPEASFAAGLLLGSRKGMPDELADAFQRTGLTHIVAISGYNITLVITLMFGLFSFIPLKWRVLLTSLAIFVFVLLVGASAAVVRAGIMGILTLWALFAGRKSQVAFALLWSAVLMVILNPYTLLFDVGFQLSFASTLGLLLFEPMLKKWIPPWEKALVLHEAFILTLAAQIGTLPLILFHFGRFSVVAPLANVLVAPFLPLAMLFSALSVVFGLPAVLLAWFFLWSVEEIALALARLPFIDFSFELGLAGFLIVTVFLSWQCFKFYRHEWGRAFACDLSGGFLSASDLEKKKREKQ
jgi:competence protein ComEC